MPKEVPNQEKQKEKKSKKKYEDEKKTEDINLKLEELSLQDNLSVKNAEMLLKTLNTVGTE